MPKMDASFNPAEYALVADRITSFYERCPTGRIVTELVSRIDRGGGAYEITFRAQVFRSADDAQPAATGFASEREDDGDINAVACVENTETSAIGRALANLGFTAALRRPSYEEMQKAARARTRLASIEGGLKESSTQVREVATGADPALQDTADRVLSVLELLAEAERGGLARDKSAPIRDRLTAPTISLTYLERAERQLRRWLAQRASGDGVAYDPPRTDRS
jgi:hypothetical protein